MIPFQLTGNAPGVIKLMSKYADEPMDFADACLVALAADYRTARILTLDRGFRIYRWGRNRPFEVLLEIWASFQRKAAGELSTKW